ncbi:MAG: hypothetical protein ACR2IR_11535 [Acidimicrobiia bacterium]
MVVVLALGILALFTTVSPRSANATNPTKPTVASAVNGRGAAAGTESPSVNPWAANGVSPAALDAVGWDCLYVVHAVHCAGPGVLASVTSGDAETFTVLVFDTTDPASTDAPFLGTEFNIRADLFQGQPCPTDPPSRQYTYLPDIGVPFEYYGCHRFDSPL